MTTGQVQLHRKLNSRILNMIAIGGCVGTGIFLASGNAIYTAGPGGVLVAYGLMGLMVYFLMTSLGEMSAYLPHTGSFYLYAERFVDPALGFALGWNYWFNWAITVASEISAASLIMNYWFPDSSPFIWSALFLFLIVGFNAISVHGFGRVEYWFSFMKVAIILIFIVFGFAIYFGLTSHHVNGFANWKLADGPFHGGYAALFNAFIIAGFSFQGTELIGIAAGESVDPEKSVPKAIKQVFWRILLFFILTIFVISLLVPFNSPELAKSSVELSPFTLVFKMYQIPYAASIINAVILIAILSAGNSGLYASTRMLWYLAKKEHLPKKFTHINRRGIPIYALLATAAISLLTFLSSVFGNSQVYFWLINASSLCGFIAWLGIAISHYRFRKAYVLQGGDIKKLPYVAKGYPYAPLFAFALCIIVIAGANYHAFLADHINWYGMLISYASVPIFLALWLSYRLLHKTRFVDLRKCDLSREDNKKS